MSIFWEAIKAKWSPLQDTQPSFTDHTILITGANTGLGFEAALKFVSLGASKVILGVRTLSKGEEAKRQIEERTGRENVVEVWHIDMLDYATIRTFADRANSELENLDVAVLNAGVVKMEYQESQYGFEETMQVNVLSTALLALLLLPKLKSNNRKTGTEENSLFTPVLEIIGSRNHYHPTTLLSESHPFAAYNSRETYTNPGTQYAVSKLFIMYVQAALTALVTPSFSNPHNHGNEGGEPKPEVYITVVCPGATQSNLERDATQWYLQPLLWLFRVLCQRKTEEGARTYVSAVSRAAELHGGFWMDDRVGGPAPLMVGENGQVLQERVWEETIEALVKDVPDVEQLARME